MNADYSGVETYIHVTCQLLFGCLKAVALSNSPNSDAINSGFHQDDRSWCRTQDMYGQGLSSELKQMGTMETFAMQLPPVMRQIEVEHLCDDSIVMFDM